MKPNMTNVTLRWAGAVLLAFMLLWHFAPVAAQGKILKPRQFNDGDSSITKQSRVAKDFDPFPHSSFPTVITLDERRLIEMDHEEFIDWIAVMPGFYPLDRAALGAPSYGQVLGLSSANLRLFFRGRALQDYLLGAPELNWIPPEALSRIVYDPFSLSTQGASIEAGLRSMEAVPPTSRVATRDGYYGLGTVDFDFGQKIAKDWVLNGGGRVATYGGRFSNSEGYGLNLRSEVAFETSQSLSGWGGVMQNKSNAEIPFTAISYNRDRYDGDIALIWKSHYIGVYGVQQRVAYGGGDRDGWDEVGTVYRKSKNWKDFECAMNLNLAAARWRLKGMSWSFTSFGSAAAAISWQRLDMPAVESQIGFDFSDDFAPERHLGLRVHHPLFSAVEFAAGAVQHQRMPSRFETDADFSHNEHFLPYDDAFLQYPTADIRGNRDLRNETHTTVFAGPSLIMQACTAAFSGFWLQVKDPIIWRVENDILRSWNASPQETYGMLGWISIRLNNRAEIGFSGSFAKSDASEGTLFPQLIGHTWVEFNQPAFQNELVMRLRIWSDYWGRRDFPIVEVRREVSENLTLNAKISAELLGVHLFWGVNNIFREQYELFPGYPMMHKEEVWGVSWNFQN
mgnify:CR=1 FL=1